MASNTARFTLLLALLFLLQNHAAATAVLSNRMKEEEGAALSGEICDPRLVDLSPNFACAGSRECFTYANGTTFNECEPRDGCICRETAIKKRSCSCQDPSCRPGEVCGQFIQAASVKECVNPVIFTAVSKKNRVYKKADCSGNDHSTAPNRPDKEPMKPPFEVVLVDPSLKVTPAPDAVIEPVFSAEPMPSPTVTPESLGEIKETGSPAEPSKDADVTATPGSDLTASASPTASTTSADDGVCISVEHLGGFASHELVFDTHRHARVLCDRQGSCATKGHMVHYDGKAMMMKTYCEMAGCSEGVGLVNSPRYQRGLKVLSRTKGLKFTALAARYESWAEEISLSALVRMGM